MNVVIIGASGLVGMNIYQYLKQKEWNVVGTHFQHQTANTVYLNTLNPDDVNNSKIDFEKVDVIIHCGALTNVDYCETNEADSYKQTVESTAFLVGIAKKYSIKFVYISTDYVFDGQSGPYAETAPTNPINVYGKHKLLAEDILQKELENILILRITNVYGNEERNKNFIARILQNIRKNEPLSMNLPIDQFATPINALDVAKAVYVLLSKKNTGIYHLGSTDYYNRYQLAKKVLSYFPEYELYNIKTTATSLLNQAAQRPLLGGLIASKFLLENPEFEFSNIDNYLKNTNHTNGIQEPYR